MRIALFTCFSPDTGGGAVNLRTLLAHLPELEVTWFHLGPAVPHLPGCVSLGPRLVGGPLPADLVRTPALWLGRAAGVEALAQRIAAGRFDRHWVVAMDEGVAVGLRLTELAPDVPLHVSVHDDQEHGMYGRSRRYRVFARLTRSPVRRLLRAARSVDTTSDEMADYYRAQLGLRSTVVHPIAANDSWPAPAAPRPPSALTVGHIGSIYAGGEFRRFLAEFRETAARLGCTPRGVFIGLLPRYHRLVREAGVPAEFPMDVPEAEAVPRLAGCDFVYAMYPFDRASRVFARTSLPTKLSTYARAGRPILAHAPEDSTLARAVVRFGTGAVASTDTPAALRAAIERIARAEADAAAFAAWRSAWYGVDNARRLRALLTQGGAA